VSSCGEDKPTTNNQQLTTWQPAGPTHSTPKNTAHMNISFQTHVIRDAASVSEISIFSSARTNRKGNKAITASCDDDDDDDGWESRS